MYGIIIVGHGKFAEGLLSSVKLILGEQDYIEGVEFGVSDSSEVLKDNIMRKIELMKDLEGIIFLTDLPGGTPFKTSVLISQDIANSKVLAGTNLPLVIEVAMNRELECIDDILQIGLSSGKDSIIVFENKESNKKNSEVKNGI